MTTVKIKNTNNIKWIGNKGKLEYYSFILGNMYKYGVKIGNEFLYNSMNFNSETTCKSFVLVHVLGE